MISLLGSFKFSSCLAKNGPTVKPKTPFYMELQVFRRERAAYFFITRKGCGCTRLRRTSGILHGIEEWYYVRDNVFITL